MAEGLNRVYLIGNLGQQPELRFTGNNNPVLSLRLATNERFKDRDGNWKDRTEWHTVVVWGKRAEGLAKILEKGTQLCIEGRLQTRQWEDRQGEKRYTTEVVARDVLLLGRKGGQERRDEGGGYEQSSGGYGGPGGGYGGSRGYGESGSQQGDGSGAGPKGDHSDDDIPF
jgi:single-strand DNA-binding protein